VRRLDALTFGLGLACVGAAGALLVTIADPAPTLGPAYTLLAFIIGGMGSVSGVLIGGVLIGLSEALAMAAVLLVAALVLHIEHRGFLLSCQPTFCSFIRQPRRR
jgi:branched-subunit amino acid ABC-type transport system permease component